MGLSATEKQSVIKQFQASDKDVGSEAVQVALLTARIKQLTAHLQQYRKDLHSQRGLMQMVSRRRKLLSYVARVNVGLYRKLINELNLRG